MGGNHRQYPEMLEAKPRTDISDLVAWMRSHHFKPGVKDDRAVFSLTHPIFELHLRGNRRRFRLLREHILVCGKDCSHQNV